MFDAKFWEEIKGKYPKAYRKLLIDTSYKLTGYNFKEKESLEYFEEAYLKNVCYCNTEEFLWDLNKIRIEIKFIKGFNIKIKKIIDDSLNSLFKSKILYKFHVLDKNIDFAKKQAIIKSFEILEEMENKE